jgi:ribonuclease G
MYNEDDAVAKVDGYMIEVVNAIPYVGEKKLVHIEEAGRTLARAVLVGAEAEEAAEAAKERGQGGQGARPAQAARGGQAGRQARGQGEGARPRGRERRARRGGRRRRRDARIEASAPRPQRRTAPFACEGRSQRVI